MIVVSSCLLGIPCRYDGSGFRRPDIMEILEGRDVLPLCPEQLGGLPTPRTPCEIVNGVVMGKDGIDRTGYFRRGAALALEEMSKFNVTVALLKEKSPSCGSSLVYDGSFSGRVIKGRGIFSSALMDMGVTVFSEENLEGFISFLI
ncbi:MULTISPECIES: DUF523 domain-containing protein [Dethiosulfovibrio]|uniref:DUF523 domain-containing protein n=2 Tax=Dethiosulfovibrio TaxID=47054 RepID=A0ABS9EP56_9BACT|nr:MULTISPECIES: DUF523 domain-containing protein [Dethiosulfovibrio]MCF4114368.1 DUF523 domain-containing protein [Dethiosulfovibrio russensis]MCF4142971.1 DUF523 domain-containing protein [Dethiosulfovibrio marinus]MCF4145068.1 DUF523 domain-containing protein [Dethiosulfovibrio acidaminovorans]